MMEKLLFLFFLMIFLSYSVFATDIYVDDDCPGPNYDGTQLDPHCSIQAAIGNVSNGDTILVSNGTYNEQITINKNNLNITSLDGALGTIINASDTSAGGIWIRGNGTIFSGFTVRDYVDSSYENKIIRIDGYDSIIKNNIVQGNLNQAGVSDQTEYGMLIYGNNSEIRNNEVYDIGYTGINVVGGPYSNTSSNLIIDNNVHDVGIYAITIDRSSDNEITNNQISDLVGGTLWGDFYDPDIWDWGIVVWGEKSQGTEIYDQDLINLPNGITLSAAKGVEVRDNIIFNNIMGVRLSNSSWLTDMVENNRIINNNISNNSLQGVLINGNASQIGNNEINNNLIYWNGIGLNSTTGTQIDAEYNWWGSCDGPSGDGPGSGDSVYGNVDYTPWLGACIGNKSIDSECIFVTNNVTLYINITSGCVDNVIFSVNLDGIWVNFTGIVPINRVANYSYTINSSLLNASEWVNWTVFITDCNNYTTKDGNEDFYVYNITSVAPNPASPNGLNNWYVTEPQFTLTNLDSVNLWYRWDGVGPFLYAGPFGLENIPNPPRPQSAGTLDLNYWTEVSCGNESTKNQTFFIDLTLPEFKDHTPTNWSNITDATPNITVYIDEVYGSNSGIVLSSILMHVDGSLVIESSNLADAIDAIVSYTPSADLSLGWHDVSVYAEDNAGWINWTNWSFNIIQPPAFTMQVNSPLDNNYYNSKLVLMNIFLSSQIEILEYIDYFDTFPRWKRLCIDCSSYNRTRSFNDGKFNETLGYANSWHNLTIRANDSYGTTVEEALSFFIDSKKPRIVRTLPLARKFVNGSYFYIKYNEDNLQEIKLYYGSNSQTLSGCEGGTNKNCSIGVELSSYDGQSINYWFNVTDFVRTVGSKVINITVDTTNPVMVLNHNVTGNYVKFDIDITETNFDRISYYDYDALSPAWRTLCTRLVNNKCVIKKSFTIGSHDVDIQARDKAGNTATQSISFTI